LAFRIASSPKADSAMMRPAMVPGSGSGNTCSDMLVSPLCIMHCIAAPLVSVTPSVHVHLSV